MAELGDISSLTFKSIYASQTNFKCGFHNVNTTILDVENNATFTFNMEYGDVIFSKMHSYNNQIALYDLDDGEYVLAQMTGKNVGTSWKISVTGTTTIITRISQSGIGYSFSFS